MASLHDLFDWYWDVLDTNHGTEVYSSRTESFIPVSDPTYTAWLAADGGNTPAVVGTLNLLASLLNETTRRYFVPDVSQGIVPVAPVVIVNPIKLFYPITNTSGGLIDIILPSVLSPKTLPVGSRVTIVNSPLSTATLRILLHDGTTVLALLAINTYATFVLHRNNFYNGNGSWNVIIEGNLSVSGTVTSGHFARFLDSLHVESVDAAAMPFVELAGDTMTGNLDIAPASGTARLSLNRATAANPSQVNGQLLGNNRWTMQLGDGAAESGGNAGSNFNLVHFNDAGVQLGNAITANRATGAVALKGSATNDNAAVGIVGEYLDSIGSGLSLSADTPANLASISLSAGDWDVTATGYATCGATRTTFNISVSTTSATMNNTLRTQIGQSIAASSFSSAVLPRVRLSLNATTTVFLVGQAVAQALTAVNAVITARRVR